MMQIPGGSVNKPGGGHWPGSGAPLRDKHAAIPDMTCRGQQAPGQRLRFWATRDSAASGSRLGGVRPSTGPLTRWPDSPRQPTNSWTATRATSGEADEAFNGNLAGTRSEAQSTSSTYQWPSCVGSPMRLLVRLWVSANIRGAKRPGIQTSPLSLADADTVLYRTRTFLGRRELQRQAPRPWGTSVSSGKFLLKLEGRGSLVH